MQVWKITVWFRGKWKNGFCGSSKMVLSGNVLTSRSIDIFKRLNSDFIPTIVKMKTPAKHNEFQELRCFMWALLLIHKACKVSKYLWLMNKELWFFKTVKIDQFLNFLTNEALEEGLNILVTLLRAHIQQHASERSHFKK